MRALAQFIPANLQTLFFRVLLVLPNVLSRAGPGPRARGLRSSLPRSMERRATTLVQRLGEWCDTTLTPLPRQL
jgi:hypothetical protein